MSVSNSRPQIYHCREIHQIAGIVRNNEIWSVNEEVRPGFGTGIRKEKIRPTRDEYHLTLVIPHRGQEQNKWTNGPTKSHLEQRVINNNGPNQSNT